MFSASIAAAGRGVAELGSCVLGCLDDAELDRAAGRLWAVIERIELGPARAKLVAGTKALHHLLPELVPPMDGEYTLSFFFGHKPFGAEGERFSFMLRPSISCGLEPREDAKSSLAVRRCRRPDRADALEPRRRAA